MQGRDGAHQREGRRDVALLERADRDGAAAGDNARRRGAELGDLGTHRALHREC
jgi:hypothetical protein